MNKKNMNKLFLITSLLTISPTVSKAESVYMCEPCPAGYACSNGVKTICPAGTYSNAVSTSCTSCTGNTYSAAGAPSCTACASGYTANSSHTACLKSCKYSFSTDCSCKNCFTTSKNAHIYCEGNKTLSTKNGKILKPYDCKLCMSASSLSYDWKGIYYFDVTLEHGDSVYGKTCDNGVMR